MALKPKQVWRQFTEFNGTVDDVWHYLLDYYQAGLFPDGLHLGGGLQKTERNYRLSVITQRVMTPDQLVAEGCMTVSEVQGVSSALVDGPEIGAIEIQRVTDGHSRLVGSSGQRSISHHPLSPHLIKNISSGCGESTSHRSQS